MSRPILRVLGPLSPANRDGIARSLDAIEDLFTDAVHVSTSVDGYVATLSDGRIALVQGSALTYSADGQSLTGGTILAIEFRTADPGATPIGLVSNLAWDAAQMQRLADRELTMGQRIVEAFLLSQDWAIVANGGRVNTMTPTTTIGDGAPLNLAGNDRIRLDALSGDIRAGDGNDIVTVTRADNAVNLFGGAGRDTLDGGTTGRGLLDGGDGADLLRGGDTLIGGRGADRLFGSAHADTFVFQRGDGMDRITAFGAGDRLALEGVYSLDQALARATDRPDGVEIALGGARVLVLGLGTADLLADDFVFGGLGNDTVTGDAGRDLLRGGIGNDSLNGLGGRDRLYGDAGDDLIDGGAGDDLIFGGAGTDSLSGGDGNDRIFDADGSGWYDGGADDDEVLLTSRAFGAQITVGGGSGDDRIDLAATLGTGARAIIDGGDGADLITVDNLQADISGGAGNDVIGGGRESVTINGNDGDDRLYGGPGNDLILGGEGNDLILGGDTAEFRVDSLYGENGDDRILGGGGSEVIFGGAGRDVIDAGASYRRSYQTVSGGDGNDRIFASGSSLLQGDEGNDRITLASLPPSRTAYLDGGEGNDIILNLASRRAELSGGAGRDQITAGSGGDDMFGGSGGDTLTAGGGRDRIHFRDGAGHDTVIGFGGEDLIVLGDRLIRYNFNQIMARMTDTVDGALLRLGHDTLLFADLSVADLDRFSFTY